MSISVAKAGQRGSVLIIALATLLIIAALGAGLLSAVSGSAENRAERLHAERAFHAAESGIRRANANGDFPDGTPVAVGGSWFQADDSFCPAGRDGFLGWSGASQIDDAVAVHALCAQLAAGGTGSAGAGQNPDNEITSPGAISEPLPANGTLENTLISAGGSVTLAATGPPGRSRSIRNVTIEAGGAVSLVLGNNPTIDNLFITANGPISIDYGGGSSNISCLLIEAGGPVSFPGQTPQLGVDYFTDPAAWEAAGCGSSAGGGTADWQYAD